MLDAAEARRSRQQADNQDLSSTQKTGGGFSLRAIIKSAKNSNAGHVNHMREGGRGGSTVN